MKKGKNWYAALGSIVMMILLAGCGDDFEDLDFDYLEDDYDDCDDYDDYDYYDCYDEDDYDDWEDDGYNYDDDAWDEYEGGDDWDYAPVNANLAASDYPLGTCGELEGKTLLVSIYINDTSCSWGSGDAALVEEGLRFLGIAAKWIGDSVSKYGCKAEFVYDWKQYSDLRYEGSVDLDITDMDRLGERGDYAAWEFIDENIDSAALLQKYDADNIAYLFLVNTPGSNPYTSCTRSFYEGMVYPYEMCFMYMFCEDEKETPAAFAHEILHAFGAPDLYSADTDGDGFGITQEYVDEMERTASNDIMYTTYDAKNEEPYYDRITNELTEIDAYYVGVTDSSRVVNEWGFGASQHR